ncbi:hypothetical protein ACQKP8_03945 [Photobacterium alginatilyticum]|uniref:hypothetical protein n=1 Tax=Photobacterium alginatilyticum TaxID=1775171 RepID=UPI0040676BF2
MLRRNPNGHMPEVSETAFIDPTAIICGKVIIEDNVFIGFNSVVFNAVIGTGCVIRHNCVVDGLDLPENFHVPPMTNIGAGFDLNIISTVPPEYSAFSESVVSANHTLVQGYRRIANEF